MSYERTKFGVFLLLLIYLFGGYFLTTDTQETYPFFSWNMFNRVPNEISSDFGIIIHSSPDKTYSPPQFFKNTPEIYNPYKDETLYQIMIRKLGNSIQQNRPYETKKLRLELETNFVKHPVIYEIVKVKFKTLEWLKDGQFIEKNSLAKFKSGNTYE